MLASNQVQYSLIYRAPETNGVLEACREHGTTLVAYSPLCQGLLTGKYSMQVRYTLSHGTQVVVVLSLFLLLLLHQLPHLNK